MLKFLEIFLNEIFLNEIFINKDWYYIYILENILSTFDMSKEEFIEYMYYYVPQLNITVSEYKNDPFWIEIKLNIPKNNLCKIQLKIYITTNYIYFFH